MKLIIFIALVTFTAAQRDSVAVGPGECAQRGIRYEGDSRFHGADMRDLNDVRNWEYCRLRCDENMKCVGWRYTTSNRACKLFSRVLRKIDDSRYVSGDRMACQSDCFQSRARQQTENVLLGRVGGFIPKCNTDGTFEKQQCRRSTGYCWCVHPTTGSEVQGTQRSPSQQKLDCNDRQCSRRGVQYTGDYVNGAGKMLAQDWQECRKRCDENPSCAGWTFTMSSRSCELFSRVLRKVDDGRYMSGDRMTCEMNCLDMKMRRERALPKVGGQPAPRVGMPQCSNDGMYTQQQCHPSSGYCWCVNPTTGAEITGTKRAPGQQRVNCDERACSRNGVRYEGDYVQGGGIRNGDIGNMRNWEDCQQRCDENMKCAGWRFMASTRACKHFSRVVRTMNDNRYVSGDKWACQTNACSRMNVQYEGDFMAGGMIRNMRTWEECRARCDQNTKCSGWTFTMSSRSCQMFSKIKRRLQNRRDYVSGDRMMCQRCNTPNCFMACPQGYQKDANGCATCACLQQGGGFGAGACFAAISRIEAENARNSIVVGGQYRPRCNRDGTFEKQQCHSSTGYCWCVHPTTGIEVAGTKRAPGQQRVNCEARACSRRGIRYEGDYMIGGKIRNVRNWEECRTRCDQNTRCAGWTFMTSSRSCELFSRVARMQDDSRYVSGDRMACQSHIRCDRNSVPPMCRMACPGGYQKDLNGCAICACMMPSAGGLSTMSKIQQQLSAMSARYQNDMNRIMRRLAMLESRMATGSRLTAGGTVYQLLKSGKCSDMGMSQVRGITACNMAARSLGLEDTNSQQGQGFQDWPDVCYYLPNNPANNRLWVSYHKDARGRWPICEKPTGSMLTAGGMTNPMGSQFRYKIIETGRCGDHYMLPIRDVTECNSAAKQLGLDDTQATTHQFPYYPEGCYYIKGDPISQRLWLSTHMNAMNGADNRRKPICKGQ